MSPVKTDAPGGGGCPHCPKWRDAYSKVKSGRDALRDAVKLLEQQLANLTQQNTALNKAIEDARSLADCERQAKAKEIESRLALEKEIASLKLEASSLQPKLDTATQDMMTQQLSRLRLSVFESEKEISRLKELVETERLRADTATKNAKTESAEAWEMVNFEKSIAEKEKMRASAESKRAEEYKLQLDALKIEAAEVKSQLTAATSKFEDANSRLETEKKKVLSEKRLAELQRNLAQANGKQLAIEKSHVSRLSCQLEEEKRRNEEMLKKINKLMSPKMKEDGDTLANRSVCFKEKQHANLLRAEPEFQRKLAQANEKNFTEETSGINALHCQLKEQKNRNDQLQEKGNNASDRAAGVEELTRCIETEKQNSNAENNRSNSKTAIVVDQKKIAFADGQKAIGGKGDGDQPACLLSESRQQIEPLRKQLSKQPSNSPEDISDVNPQSSKTFDRPQVRLLREQIKKEKMRVKHAKQVAKFEKVRNSILQKELDLLKQEFPNHSLSHKAEVTGITVQVEGSPHLRLQKEQNPLSLPHYHSEGGGCTKSLHAITKSSNYVGQHLKDALIQPVPRKLDESVSGTDFKLGPPTRGSEEDLFDSSAINSCMASYSDRFVDSQETNGCSGTTSSSPVDGINLQETDSKLSGEVTEYMRIDKPAMIGKLITIGHNSVLSGGEAVHNKKRKRILSLLDSLDSAFSKSKKIHMQMEQNISMLHNELKRQEDATAEGRYLSHSDVRRSYQKEKLSQGKTICSQCSPNANHLLESNNLESNGETSCLCCLTPLPSNYTSEDTIVNMVGDVVTPSSNGCNFLELFDLTTDGDYMILLNLNDQDEEKRYRIARENLLSPSHPEVKIHSSILVSLDKTDNHPNSKQHDSWPSCCPLLLKNESRVHCPHDIVVANSQQTLEPVMKMDVSNLVAHGTKGKVNHCECDSALCIDDVGSLYLVYYGTIDYDTVSRIHHATQKGISQCDSSLPSGIMLKRMLNFIIDEDLQPKEKMCVFLSLILRGCYAIALRDLSNPIRETSSHLITHTCDVFSVLEDMETRNYLEQLFTLDELLNLVEQFILDGRIWVCINPDQKPSVQDNSPLTVHLDDTKVVLETASSEHLVAAGAILASLCVALDEIDFIYLSAYNLFRLHQYNITVMLSIVHAFAQTVERSLIRSTTDSLVIIVVNSLVKKLYESLHSPFLKFPFSEEAVSVDAVIFLLLERLQWLQQTVDAGIPCNGSVVQKLNCGQPDPQSSLSLEKTLSEFSDVLSLLELVANHMSWDLLSSKVVPQLLLLMESSIVVIFSVAIVALLGQLGRIGVNFCGTKDAGVDMLRCRLTGMLCSRRMTMTLQVEIAIVCSLARFLNLDLNMLLVSDGLILLPVDEGDSASQIRRWFSSLSEDQQSFSIGILREIDVNGV